MAFALNQMPATPVAPAAATAPLESPAKFLVAYLLYFLLNGVINMKQRARPPGPARA